MLHAFAKAAREALIENVSRRQILKGAAAAGSLVLAAPFARAATAPTYATGAGARTMLEEAAAQKWNVKPDEVKASNHEVVHAASGRRIAYGELAAEAAKLPVPKLETLRLKDESEFRYIGKGNIPFVDLHDI